MGPSSGRIHLSHDLVEFPFRSFIPGPATNTVINCVIGSPRNMVGTGEKQRLTGQMYLFPNPTKVAGEIMGQLRD